MTSSANRSVLRAMLLVGLLGTALLSGCVGDDSEQGRYASYEQARTAEGPVYEANNSDSDVRLKLLAPLPGEAVPGETEVVILLFDEAAGEPLTDADVEKVALAATMPAMGHGTSGEEDPVHDAHGVYIGKTNFLGAGEWRLNIDVTLADDTTLEFLVDIAVGGEATDGGMHGNRSGNRSGNMTGNRSGNMSDNMTGNMSGNMTGPDDYNETFTDSINSAGYEQNWTFEVESMNATITLNVTLNPPVPPLSVDEITVTLFDANGTRLGEVTVSGASTETLSVSELGTTGTYAARVTGQGVGSNYELTVLVAYR